MPYGSMPSQSNPGALFALGTVKEDSVPWVWDFWQARTGLDKAPWYSEGVFEADEAQSVLAFVIAFHDPVHEDKIEFMRQNDEWNEGRRLWKNWVNERWQKVWGIYQSIDELLVKHNISPYKSMARNRKATLPTRYEAELRRIDIDLGVVLFGSDAWISQDDPGFLSRGVIAFIDSFTANAWSRHRKSTKRMLTSVENLTAESLKNFEALSTSD